MYSGSIHLHRFTFLFSILLCSANLLGRPYSHVTAEKFWVPDGDVYATARTADHVYIGGDFDYVGRYTGSGVVFVNADSTTTSNLPDLAFCRINGPIYAAVPDGDGGWYIGGDFSYITWEQSGFIAGNIARIKSNRNIDTDFQPRLSGPVYALARSGTDLFVGGDFTTVTLEGSSEQVPKLNAAKFTTDGTLNTTWSVTVSAPVRGLAISGTELGVGSGASGSGNFKVVKTDTAATQTLSANPGNIVRAVAADNNNWYIGGDFGAVSYGVSSLTVSNWDPDVVGSVFCIALPGDGSIFIGGEFDGVKGEARENLAHTDNNGLPYAHYIIGGEGKIESLAIIGNVLYAGGDFLEDTYGRNLAAFNFSNGFATRLTDFHPNLNGPVTALCISNDGTDYFLFAGGEFAAVDTQPAKNLARLNAGDGALDTTWLPNPNAPVRALQIDATNGKLYAGGSFSNIGDGSLVRFTLSTGAQDNTWTGRITSTYNDVHCIALDGNYVYVGGNFSLVDDSTNDEFQGLPVRFSTSTGEVDRDWKYFPQNYSGDSCWVNAIFPVPSVDAVYIGGRFDDGLAATGTSQSVYPTHLAKLYKSCTGVVEAWKPGPTGGATFTSVNAIETVSGAIIAGGRFSSIGGGSRHGLAAIDSSTGYNIGTADAHINSGGIVNSIAVSGTELFLGGKFSITDTVGFINGNLSNPVDNVKKYNRQNLCSISSPFGNLLPWNPACSSGSEIYSVTANPIAAAGTGKFAVDCGGSLGSVGINALSGFATFLPHNRDLEILPGKTVTPAHHRLQRPKRY